jgi:hypothetical protein
MERGEKIVYGFFLWPKISEKIPWIAGERHALSSHEFLNRRMASMSVLPGRPCLS